MRAVVHGDRGLHGLGRRARQAHLFGHILSYPCGGQGEVVLAPGENQAGVVQECRREQQFGVDLQPFQFAQGTGECIRAVAVVDQGGR